MTTKDPNDSVQNEQFDSVESSVENAEEKVSSEEVKEEITESVQEAEKADESNLEKEPAAEASEETSDTTEQMPEETTGPAEPAEDDLKEEIAPKVEKAEPEAKPEDLPQVDYSNRSRADLVETLDLLLENRPPGEIRDDVEKIKILFYKKYKSEVEEIKSKFLSDGGVDEEFKPPVDELEIMMKKLLSKYRGRKAEYSKQFEIEKQENLKRKYEIIDQIKDLVNREESINITFQEFRDLQNEWYNLGAVPQSSLKNLWETYNHNVEIFYDYIKINKELRDLDFKKNKELKLTLCEKAEELISNTNTVGSFRTLQEFHQRWREIGPVPREERNQLWERFKEATSQVNKKHHEYFEKQKDDQRKNMEAKTALCEKIEAILELKTSSFRDWEDRAKDVIELQKDWRKIGFAPKRHNTSIYTRFREGCDKFFQAKREFYAANKEVQIKNLELKTKLCERAEELQNVLNGR